MRKELIYIMKFAKPYRISFIIVLLSILVTTLIVATYPYLFGEMVDTLFYGGEMLVFIRILAMYISLYVVNQLLHFVLDMTTAKLRTQYLFDIKKHIFKRVLSYKGSVLTGIKSGDIIYRMNQDTDEIMNFIYTDVFYGISAVLDLAICLGIVAVISVPLAIISTALAVGTFFFSRYFSNRVKPIQKKLVEMLANNESWLFELLHCMRDIRLLAATRNCIKRYVRNDIVAIRITNKKSKCDIVAESGNAGIQMLCTVGIYAVSAMFIFGGMMTLGNMIACIDYFRRIVLMLTRINARFQTYPARMIAIDRIMAIEDEEIEDYNGGVLWKRIHKGSIEFCSVGFSYNNEKKVLSDVSFTIRQGEHVALVGESGTGKSTMAHLLCRLYEPGEGKILIDGEDINDFNLPNLRSQIGIAHQEALMFNNTIRYNLIFSDDVSDDEKIWNVLEQVQLKNIVRDTPNGLNTVLDPSMQGLSGGQRQRLMIARLILKDAAVIIFDESTSSLDGETESGIIATWDTLLRGKTLLIIAHRLSTILNADRVVCLSDGHMVGYGSHEELLEKCETYNTLFFEQYTQHSDT